MGFRFDMQVHACGKWRIIDATREPIKRDRASGWLYTEATHVGPGMSEYRSRPQETAPALQTKKLSAFRTKFSNF